MQPDVDPPMQTLVRAVKRPSPWTAGLGSVRRVGMLQHHLLSSSQEKQFRANAGGFEGAMSSLATSRGNSSPLLLFICV